MVRLPVIPEGTFFAMEPERYAAMERVHKIGEQLARDYPWLGEAYADTTKPFTAREIAHKLMPDVMERSIAVGMTAVTYAVGLLLPKLVRDEATRIRRSMQMETLWDFYSPEWFEHQRKAAQARHSKGIAVDVKAMLDARGRTAWTTEEKEVLFQAAADPQYRTGAHGGADYKRIAHDLNGRFHEGRIIRYENSCRSFIGYTRKMAKKRSQSG